MKVVIQRVKKAEVKVNKKTIGKINNGLLLFVGFTHNDDINTIKYIVNKIINLRIFDDLNGIMNLSIIDKKYDILSVSQFTLYGDCTKGNRPSYINSLNYEQANKLYDIFNEELKLSSINVETGKFRSDMEVALVNDGPVTIILER